MSLKVTGPQMTRQLVLPVERRGEASSGGRSEEASLASQRPEAPGMCGLLEVVLSRANLFAALKRVRQNKGAPGVDGMTVHELGPYLRDHWLEIREQLMKGRYRPQPVRWCEIPKDGGGKRMLGIPTVVDRLIQQALLQALQPLYDPTFSPHSHGFRPGRSAHGALLEAREHVRSGRQWVVDVDLSKFFDRVNHDILMGLLSRRIGDKRVLKLIRAYLSAGILAHGVVIERAQGTPQGGPLSPLLANILLNEVDQMLESRGHAFVRYADDCRVFVGSSRAGERVMRSLRRSYERLGLVVNEEKSAVAPFWSRPFLSYWLYRGRKIDVGLVPSEKSLKQTRSKLRAMTRRMVGKSLEEVVRWLRPRVIGIRNYYRLSTYTDPLRQFDGWLRHRLRALLLSRWKKGKTIAREYRALGASDKQIALVTAFTGRWWKMSGGPSHSVLTIRFFDRLGVPRFVA